MAQEQVYTAAQIREANADQLAGIMVRAAGFDTGDWSLWGLGLEALTRGGVDLISRLGGDRAIDQLRQAVSGELRELDLIEEPPILQPV